MKDFLIIYAIIIAVMSLITLIFYFADKRKAINGKWRIPEATLLGLSFFGGAVGGLFAMTLFRHKTKHWYFWAVNIIALIIHIAIPVIVCIFVIGVA
jgi:uncharacterized membrane protein YsdA (DUF1294 family)